MADRHFMVCEKCGRKLIERTSDGLFHFVFGKNPSNPGNPPVDIWIHGNLKIKCFRRTCEHINVLNYFPF